MKHQKDNYSTNEEASESRAEAMRESMDPSAEAKEPPSEHELDMHHETLMKAEKIKGDAHIMKHLKPHMEMKMKHMKGVMGEAQAPKKAMSLDDIKAKAKSL